ncbi:LAGLIDADG family homing endonuclease [Micromonospora chersina]|uniref:LAGLIDADG family homing endonuclease n=1 Tax=Micromonospora chersina TaxID=47854 RepID=UPI00371D5C19
MAIDSLVPTLDGWKSAREVAVGDTLFDESGRATRVRRSVSLLDVSRRYRVEFRDGTAVIADASQLWPLREFAGAYEDRLASTAEVLSLGVTYERRLTSGKTKASRGGVARWRTLATPALNLDECPLPLSPYLLGYWLGDGDSDGPRITVHEEDLPSLEREVEVEGARIISRQRTHGKTFRVRFDLGSYGTGIWALRDLGVLANKHIPSVVFRASRSQRLHVLQGLVDSDGYIEKRTNRVELCFTAERLAKDAVELIRTLGLYPRMSSVAAVLNGQRVGTRHRINFTAYSDDAVSRLARKLERLGSKGSIAPYSRVRTLVGVTLVDRGPAFEIEVDSPNGLYLVGEGMIPVGPFSSGSD